MASIKVALIGLGTMGLNHLRILQRQSDVELIGVVDTSENLAHKVSQEVGCHWSTHIDEFLQVIDAAIVATPTHAHLSSVEVLHTRGIHVLVEKPFVATSHELSQFLQVYNPNGSLVMVGHVERFNPAILQVSEIIDSPIVHFAARRESAVVSRIPDSVVLDLMIHDLDLFSHLTHQAIASTSSVGTRDRRGVLEGASTVVMGTEGSVGTLTASRLGQDKVREIRLTLNDCLIVVDLLRRTVEVHRLTRSSFLEGGIRRYRESTVKEIPLSNISGESLELQFRHFLDVVSGRTDKNTTATLEGVVPVLESCFQIDQTILTSTIKPGQ